MRKRILSITLIMTVILSVFAPTRILAAAEVTLAEFKYVGTSTDAGNNMDGDKDAGYAATDGVMKSEAKLFASVDGSSKRKLEWSKAEYEYNGAKKQVVPIMTASAKNPWGESPYFEVSCPTLGYESVNFSAQLGASKKGPANYALWYSADGKNYTHLQTAASISDNKKMTELFAKVNLPAAASDCNTVYFRIQAADTATVGGASFKEQTGGEAAINDIIVRATPKSATPKLTAPTASISGGEIYGNTAVKLTCAFSDAEIYYTINNGAETKYDGKFMPFEGTSATTVTVRAWAKLDGYETSDTAEYVYTATKDEITSFDFADSGNLEYVNGDVAATSGVYPDGKISASLDGKTKYSPLYSSKKGAISISPDDTYTWHEDGYWQTEIRTKGYDAVYMTANAFSSDQGPASVTVKYSTDGVNFKDIEKNRAMPTDNTEPFYSGALPTDAANADKLYIRFVTEEDKTASGDGTPLFENRSKGNSYISKIVFSGNRSQSVKAPYTTKATAYFGANGSIAYKSADNSAIKYGIYTQKGTPVIENADYSDKISLASLAAFDPQLCGTFRLDVWSENGGDKSGVNSATYTYKGDVISEFDISEFGGGTVVNATRGDARLSVYPNGKTAAELTYTGKTKALRASADIDNSWNFDTERKNPDIDGYWLITASTKGYKNIKFSADQCSTGKGPRDFCIMYSVDGANYKKLADSSIHVTDSASSTYSNIALPSEADNRDKIYIKIKIDGGENVNGDELSVAPDSGNTDINNIEICGIKIGNKVGIDGNPTYLEKGKTYLINSVSDGGEYVVISAGYSGGEMTFCKLGEDRFTVPQSGAASSVKLMMWKNILSMTPIIPEVEFSVE